MGIKGHSAVVTGGGSGLGEAGAREAKAAHGTARGAYNAVRLTAARLCKVAPLDGGECGVIMMTAQVAAFGNTLRRASR